MVRELNIYFFFFSSRRRHTSLQGDWSSDVCSSDLADARRPEDIDPTFRKFKAEGVDVVIVLQANSLILDRAQIAIAAAATRLPTVFGYREHVETGGLISYGDNLDHCFRRAGSYVHNILKGTSVAD